MKEDAILERNSRYKVIQSRYEKELITMRVWAGGELSEILLDDAFARANGHRSREAFIEKVGKENLVRLYGRVPEWIAVTPEGDFHVQYLPKTELN